MPDGELKTIWDAISIFRYGYYRPSYSFDEYLSLLRQANFGVLSIRTWKRVNYLTKLISPIEDKYKEPVRNLILNLNSVVKNQIHFTKIDKDFKIWHNAIHITCKKI